MTSYDLQITQGNTFNLTLNATDNNNNPIDLTFALVSGYIKYNYTTGIALANLNPTILSPSISGIVSINIDAGTTANLPIVVAPYNINAYFTGQNTVIPILFGNAYVNPSVFGIFPNIATGQDSGELG